MQNTTKDRIIPTGTEMFSTFAVDDIEAARRFYGDTLGLDVRDGQMEGLIEIHPGSGTPVTVYPKPDHQPADFTVLNFLVSDVEAVVDALSAAGVRIEHYDGTDGPKTNEKGIATDGGGTIAWFRDPARNVLSVIGRDAS
ncbi:MAG: VOC family protein [Chloroflexota bacterium]